MIIVDDGFKFSDMDITIAVDYCVRILGSFSWASLL